MYNIRWYRDMETYQNGTLTRVAPCFDALFFCPKLFENKNYIKEKIRCLT